MKVIIDGKVQEREVSHMVVDIPPGGKVFAPALQKEVPKLYPGEHLLEQMGGPPLIIKDYDCL